MHERYMVPGVLLTLLAAAHWNDIRLYAAGVGLSLTGFINLATVYSLTGSDDEWLTSATSSTVAVLTGLGGDGLLCAADVCSVGHCPPWPHAGPARGKAGNCPRPCPHRSRNGPAARWAHCWH